MKLPRRRGATLPVTSAIAGPKRPVTNTKNTMVTASTCASGTGGQVRHHEDAARSEMHGEDREHPLLAVAVGEPADDLAR